MSLRRRIATMGMLTALLAIGAGAAAQKESVNWAEWSRKDAETILNNSPWAQTQVEMDTSEMMYSPTNSAPAGTAAGIRGDQRQVNKNRAAEGAYNQTVETRYQIRFLSAKPVREALATMILLQQGEPDSEDKRKTRDQVRARMQEFVDRDFRDFIVVTVTFEASDGRFTGKVFQDFSGAAAGTLKNNTYLERNDGQRLFLIDYRVPIDDGLGARFVFPRNLNGRPFLNGDSREVRFYSEVGSRVKLNRRFKVSDMFYHGKLEY